MSARVKERWPITEGPESFFPEFNTPCTWSWLTHFLAFAPPNMYQQWNSQWMVFIQHSEHPVRALDTPLEVEGARWVPSSSTLLSFVLGPAAQAKLLTDSGKRDGHIVNDSNIDRHQIMNNAAVNSNSENVVHIDIVSLPTTNNLSTSE